MKRINLFSLAMIFALIVTLLGTPGVAVKAYTLVSNAWLSAGSMSEPRDVPGIVELPDHTILVLGGYNAWNGNATATVEKYDPTTNSWSFVSPMSTPRAYPAVVLLSNGKVLVIGGRPSASGSLTSAELYDPATNTWSSAGFMTNERYLHTATLLQNGKVLVVGGYCSNCGGYLSSAELYDPATNSWSSAGNISTPVLYHSATLLPNGKVLVLGGTHDPSHVSANADLYDPATNSWSPASSMIQPHRAHTATLLQNGKVLVAGGPDDNGLAELYDPANDSWSPAGSMAQARYVHIAVLLQDGRVLVVGGQQYGIDLANAELYNPISNSWSSAGSMSIPRSSYVATLLVNGNVLVAGGLTDPSTVTSSAEIYHPSYTLIVQAIGAPYGTVTSDPAGINCNPNCEAIFDPNTVVKLTATPAPDQVFFKWLGACESYGSDPICYVTMDQAKSVKAIFHKSYYWKLMASLSNPVLWSNTPNGKTFTGTLYVEVELNGQSTSRDVDVPCREVKEASDGYITPPAQAGDRAYFYHAKLKCDLTDIEQVAEDLGYPLDGINAPHYEVFSEPISDDSNVIMRWKADSEDSGYLFRSPSFTIKKQQNNNGADYIVKMVYTADPTTQSCGALGWDTLNGTVSDPHVVQLDLTPSQMQWNGGQVTSRTSEYFEWLVGMNTTFTIAGADANGTTDIHLGDIEIDPKTTGGGGRVGTTSSAASYVAGTVPCSISGNTGTGGVTMSYNDGGMQSAISDANGIYAMYVSPDWTGTITPSKTNYVFTPLNRSYTNVTSNQTGQNYTATLLTYSLTVKRDGSGPGAVSTTPPSGISECTASECTAIFPAGTKVTLTGTAATGSIFKGFPGTCPNETSCTVEMTQNMTVNALFVKEQTKNGNFESYTAASPKVPTNWSAANINLSMDGKDTVTKFKGIASMKFTGIAGKTKSLKQTLTLSGKAGDAFVFSYWVKGSNLSAAGVCQAEVRFYNGTTAVGAPKVLPCNFTGTFAYKQRALPLFTAPGTYTAVSITFISSKVSGTVSFDWVSLLR